ncbi:methylated-DNA--[protein]-cysteine S-methyltransferase [Aliifodinibius sp. S!AR15-10]|uniref:methylated-DNA--[protein]-cysteine S-methyltransferase n=1 Tax=Aliifodinibius sp. S!AR15-10 TaxID=2950437 RepID=UPI0028669424|nr:methylated-DNA--[protein]-cysteine S-methyltransferase [Aliifodinibius sp. S!AR15-10]MDR8390109.1 methylated-DNA--[protein]-cysteine S-methyltransferase [Aliifodinibius sp. S!AR15-10]
MKIDELETPVGTLQITVNENYIRKIIFTDRPDGARTSHPVLLKVRAQLREYFEGKRKTFDLPLQPEGTEFQQRVWKVLSNIPYGTTITYQELAEKLGNPDSIRAAGRANGQNPLPIVIPCHRVIGANGKLVGYSGGIDRKKWLLKYEGALLI